MTELSPAAQAVWEAFNEDEAGVLVDYGEKLAAALRVAANRLGMELEFYNCKVIEIDELLAIAAELEGHRN